MWKSVATHWCKLQYLPTFLETFLSFPDTLCDSSSCDYYALSSHTGVYHGPSQRTMRGRSKKPGGPNHVYMYMRFGEWVSACKLIRAKSKIACGSKIGPWDMLPEIFPWSVCLNEMCYRHNSALVAYHISPCMLLPMIQDINLWGHRVLQWNKHRVWIRQPGLTSQMRCWLCPGSSYLPLWASISSSVKV